MRQRLEALLEEFCTGMDDHGGLGEKHKKSLFERCEKCREIGDRIMELIATTLEVTFGFIRRESSK